MSISHLINVYLVNSICTARKQRLCSLLDCKNVKYGAVKYGAHRDGVSHIFSTCQAWVKKSVCYKHKNNLEISNNHKLHS